MLPPSLPSKGNHYRGFWHHSLILPGEGRTTMLKGIAMDGHWGGKKWGLGLVWRGSSLSQGKGRWRILEPEVHGAGPAVTEGKGKGRESQNVSSMRRTLLCSLLYLQAACSAWHCNRSLVNICWIKSGDFSWNTHLDLYVISNTLVFTYWLFAASQEHGSSHLILTMVLRGWSIVILLFRWGNWDSERLNAFLKVTCRLSHRIWIYMWSVH